MNNFNKSTKKFLYTIIIGIIINVISSSIYGKFQKVNFLTAFKEVWIHVFNFFMKILLFDIKVWHLIIVVILATMILFLLYKSRKNNTKISKPEFLKYTRDIYKRINYKWTIESYGGVVSIVNLRPVCKCGGELTLKDRYRNMYYSREKLYCVNCDEIIDEKYDGETLQDANLYFSNNLNKKIDEHNLSIKQ